MTQDEYYKRLKKLRTNFEKAQFDLITEFALSNNLYNIGDILIDDTGIIIRVEKISVSYPIGNDLPCCQYQGRRLTKDLLPRKQRPYTSVIWQFRVERKLN